MSRSKLDFEARANRFLDAMSAVQAMLAHAVPGFNVDGCDMAQLLGLLNDEARKVVIPSRGCANDDGDEDK
jgi:hypothetical protein